MQVLRSIGWIRLGFLMVLLVVLFMIPACLLPWNLTITYNLMNDTSHIYHNYVFSYDWGLIYAIGAIVSLITVISGVSVSQRISSGKGPLSATILLTTLLIILTLKAAHQGSLPAIFFRVTPAIYASFLIALEPGWYFNLGALIFAFLSTIYLSYFLFTRRSIKGNGGRTWELHDKQTSSSQF